jgi:uncharacterized SAM-dependent methyltransferase
MAEEAREFLAAEVCLVARLKHRFVLTSLTVWPTLIFLLGNFRRHEAPSFLKSFRDVLSPSDMFLIGVDATSNPGKI